MMTLMGQTDVKPSKSETGPTSIVSHLLYKMANFQAAVWG